MGFLASLKENLFPDFYPSAPQEDLKLAIQRKDPDPKEFEKVIKEERRQRTPVKFHRIPNRSTRQYAFQENQSAVSSPYDLAECIKLQDIDSYYSTSVDRHVELIMKKGYYLSGKNPDAVAYVERRLKEMAYVSGTPTEDVFRQGIRDTVTTSTGLLVLKRDPTRSSGRRIKKYGKELEPISAVYNADPSTVSVRQSSSGRPTTWIQQIPGGGRKEWPHHDVIHIPLRRKSGFLFGTPFIIPVLEDIRALRKLEAMAEHVAHKFAFPLLHWKVGTETLPAHEVVDPDTGARHSEIAIADSYLESMAQEGYVVTSERHEIKIIGAEGERLDIGPFIDHYEMRVLGGLRISQMDLGRGDTANKGTASALSQILVDACTEIQRVFAEMVTFVLINDLLFEGGFDPLSDDAVFLMFPAINSEEQRAHENHGLNLYVSGGIQVDEFRRDYLGRNPFSEEDVQKTFLNQHLIPLAEAAAEAKAAAAPEKTSAVKNASRNRVQPENQYVKLPTKPRVTANDQDPVEEMVWDDIHRVWSGAGEQLVKAVMSGEDGRAVISRAMNLSFQHFDQLIRDGWKKGFLEALSHTGVQAPGSFPTDDESMSVEAVLKHARARDLPTVLRNCMISAGLDLSKGLRTDGYGGSMQVRGAVSATEHLLATSLDRARMGAHKLGYVAGTKYSGVPHITMTRKDNTQERVSVSERGLLPMLYSPSVVKIEAGEVVAS